MSYNNYNQIYRAYGELGFPQPDRAYFDYISTEFNGHTVDRKLLDIGYLLWHGYDVRATIHDTYRDHDTVTDDNVRFSICMLLAELWHEQPVDVCLRLEELSLDGLIDELFRNILSYYHIPVDPYKSHYIKSPIDMTEKELRDNNPWQEVAALCERNDFLCSEKNNLVCAADKAMIDEFNATAKEEHQYKLNVPPYPWVGNPLTAKVIALSLNPGYVERETTIAKLFQELHPGLVEGYSEHLRSALRLNCRGLLPDDNGTRITYRDLANIHQSYYWQNRLEKAFVRKESPDFETVNSHFAVIQYVGYSSEKYHSFKKGRMLPSQHYTRQLIEYILRHRPEVLFVVARAKGEWEKLIGDLMENYRDRFIESKAPRSQSFSAAALGEEAHRRLVEALSCP